MKERFYITTAIDYVNGEPHLGHAYEKIITDVLARAHRSLGHDVYFLTGLDEHGQKVQQAAQAAGKSPQEYCDELAQIWKAFAARLNLTNNAFIRTSDAPHKAVVSAILAKLHGEGQFYQEAYEGYYSAKEETFLTDKDREDDGQFDPKYGEVVQLKESNWYFRLKAHQQWLIDHIEANPDFVYPAFRRNEVLGLLKNNPLEDLCCTRPIERLSWGIPLPFDKDYVTYVWFDALTNYVSQTVINGDRRVIETLGLEGFQISDTLEQWPAAAHVIGKDILKFHAVYWPIMLKAMGLPLPKQVLAHGFWQKDNQKISKSTGNIVDPIEVIDEWGVDAFRYYVTRELELGPDGNWTDDGFSARYQAELANGLGNLVNRSLSMLNRYREGIVPPPHDELAEEAKAVVASTLQNYQSNKIQGALLEIWKLVTRANQYVDQTAPFKLAKDPEASQRLDEVLYNLVETSRILAILLWPVIPETAEKIFQQLNLSDPPDRFEKAAWGQLINGHKTNKPAPLFPRKDLAKK